MNRNSAAVLMSIALTCLAVALALIAVISDFGPTWAWISLAAMAIAAGSALLRMGTLTARSEPSRES
jgi:NADH:ubiquinone oxidoreductase subunit K